VVFDTKIEISSSSDSALLPCYGSLTAGSWRVACSDRLQDIAEIERLCSKKSAHTGVMIFVFGIVTCKQREELLYKFYRKNIEVLIFDESLFLFALAESRFNFIDMIEVAQAFAYSNPYDDYSGRSIPPEIFIGRSEECKRILHPTGAFYVHGGRRLGKTSLLQFVQANYHAPNEGRIVIYVPRHETVVESLWTKASAVLTGDKKCDLFKKEASTGKAFVEEIRRWLAADQSRSFLMLIDECDSFIEEEAKTNKFQDFMLLYNLMQETQHRFKIVLAGLNNLLRYTRSPNTPLSQIDRGALNIGPLMGKDILEAEKLVTRPLAGLGYRFESREDVWRILNFSMYYPVLIQLVCKRLIERLTARVKQGQDVDRSIDSELVEELLDDSKTYDIIESQVIKKTLDLDPTYRVILLVIANNVIEQQQGARTDDGMSLKEISESAATYWPQAFEQDNLGSTDLFALLEEMIGLGLVKRVSDRRYTIRSRMLIRMLGGRTPKEDIPEMLLGYIDTPPPQRFEFAYKRTRISSKKLSGSDNDRCSPLNTGDLTKILDGEPSVHAIFGLGLSDVTYCGRCIESSPMFNGDEGSRKKVVESFSGREAQDLASHVSRLNRRNVNAVVIVSNSVNWRPEWVRGISEMKALRSGKIRVVFIGGPGHARLWAKAGPKSSRFDTVTLEPWRKIEIFTHLKQSHHDDPETAAQDILTRTGGWNSALSKVFLDHEIDISSLEKCLLEAEKELETHLTKEGFGLEKPLAAILTTVIDELLDKESFSVENGAFGIAIDSLTLGDEFTEEFVVRYLMLLGLVHERRLPGTNTRRPNGYTLNRLLVSCLQDGEYA
jgi:hypothetical protein